MVVFYNNFAQFLCSSTKSIFLFHFYYSTNNYNLLAGIHGNHLVITVILKENLGNRGIMALWYYGICCI